VPEFISHHISAVFRNPASRTMYEIRQNLTNRAAASRSI
jgi:hypothetical protein